MAHNSTTGPRVKHIDVLHHFTRECIERGQIKLEYISTHEMVADVFTKILPRVKFEICIAAMGMH